MPVQRLKTGRSSEFADSASGGGAITRLESEVVSGAFAVPAGATWGVVTGTPKVFTLVNTADVEIYGSAKAERGAANIADCQLGIRVAKTGGATTDYPGTGVDTATLGEAVSAPVFAQKLVSLAAGEYTISLIARAPGGHGSVTLLSDASFPTRMFIEYGDAGSILQTPTYVFASPGDLTTTDNDLIPWLPGRGEDVSGAKAIVKTAPVGAAITVDIQIIDTATGTVDSVIDTVTIADGAFEGTVTFAAPVNIPTTKGLGAAITQVGVGTAGKNLTIAVF